MLIHYCLLLVICTSSLPQANGFFFNSATRDSKSIPLIIENEIIPLVANTRRGLDSSKNPQVIDIIEKIKAKSSSKSYATAVNGKWKVAWTTEKVSYSIVIAWNVFISLVARKRYFLRRVDYLVVNVPQYHNLLIHRRSY